MFFGPQYVCAARKTQCTTCSVCVAFVETFNCGLATCMSRPPCAPHSQVCAPHPLKPAPTHSNAHDFALAPLQCLSKACNSTMPLIWIKTCIYSLGRHGFNFCFLENPVSNVVFCTFSLTLKHTNFHFSSEILAQMMKFSALFIGIA